MSAYVSNAGLSGNARLKKLDTENKLNNTVLFEVVNLITGVQTHVPGGAIARFLNQDYMVREVGENKPGAVGAGEPGAAAEDIAASIIADAEAKAAEIIAAAQKAAQKVNGKPGADKTVPNVEKTA